VDRAVAQRWFVAAAERGHKEALKISGVYLSSEPEGVVRSGRRTPVLGSPWSSAGAPGTGGARPWIVPRR
jgi:hypothetical protein